MANNIVSEQLPMQSIQMGQMEHIANNHSLMQMGSVSPGIDGSVLQTMPNNPIGIGPASTNILSEHIPISNNQTQVFRPLSNRDAFPKFPTSSMQMRLMGPDAYNPVQRQFLLPNQPLGAMVPMFNNAISEQSSILSKRKSMVEPTSNNSPIQYLSVPNKRVIQMEHRPWLQQTTTLGRPPIQLQSMSNHSGSQRSQPSKRSNSNKAGQQLPNQRNQTGHVQTPLKRQSESFESVRSKLRQSLADALALVTQQPDKTSSAENNSQGGMAYKPGYIQERSQHPGQSLGTADADEQLPEGPKENLTTLESSATQNVSSGLNSSQGTSTSVSADNLNNNGLEPQPGTIINGEDVSFAKDELLQGNGLSWVLEPDMEVKDEISFETSEKQPVQDKVSAGQVFQDPQILATKIEAELFKLFEGVNKKYKEKGRSLLFNLKDRNNPALRERVMSGEIPPERLCSMSAEELASEELSQWRMAKAEELAQMVVLPDSDVDIRRLVRKTHKGEFQVEVDEQDSISIDVAITANSQTHTRPKVEEKQEPVPMKHDEMDQKLNVTDDKHNLEGKAVPCTLDIPSNESNDLMQGLMVDDELKDAEFLTPIVSLDEFMESLDSEPPFENLPSDAEKSTSDFDKDEYGKTTCNSDKDNSPVRSDSNSSCANPKDFPDTCVDNPDKTDMANAVKNDANGKNIDILAESRTSHRVAVSKSNHVWEGLLQLNVSATSPVVGIFKSGEKTSVNEWSRFIEVKGRVRLDAFEKFLQELPMSRSRAVMAVHFICEEGATESEHASVIEAADSYVLDGRVGFAEPAPGVELYLCPPHSRTREMIIKVLPKDQVDELNTIDNGLIGVIVWRKPQIASTISPNSTSLRKHTSKKQNFTTSSFREKDTNVKLNTIQKHHLAHGGPHSNLNPLPDDNDDDDLPPGFGPPGARDEDDLPEFNFSGGPITPRSKFSALIRTRRVGQGSHSRNASSPADQMRELVHRYGQSKPEATPGNWQRSIGNRGNPWDDDDDDDMPEWQPESAQRQHQNLHSVQSRGLKQPLLRVHMGQQTPHQSVAPTGNAYLTPLQQSQVNVIYGRQASPWQGTGMVPPAYESRGVHFYGTPANGVGQQGSESWRRDQSRGF